MHQAQRRASRSRDQKIFLVGNKTDAYADQNVWGEEEGRPNAEIVARLNSWKPRRKRRHKLSKYTRRALQATLSTRNRERRVSKTEARAVVRNGIVRAQFDLWYFRSPPV